MRLEIVCRVNWREAKKQQFSGRVQKLLLSPQKRPYKDNSKYTSNVTGKQKFNTMSKMNWFGKKSGDGDGDGDGEKKKRSKAKA